MGLVSEIMIAMETLQKANCCQLEGGMRFCRFDNHECATGFEQPAHAPQCPPDMRGIMQDITCDDHIVTPFDHETCIKRGINVEALKRHEIMAPESPSRLIQKERRYVSKHIAGNTVCDGGEEGACRGPRAAADFENGDGAVR